MTDASIKDKTIKKKKRQTHYQREAYSEDRGLHKAKKGVVMLWPHG